MGYSNGRVEPGADTAGLRGRPGLVEEIDEACRYIEALDSDIRALLPEADRRSRLLEEAGRLQTEAAADLPLFGMLVAVKDIIHVDGFETRAGSQLPAAVLAGPEAGCIRALRAAGALVLGKAVTTEFACFKPAATRNPRNLRHSPGGSSSGSAAAVAAGYCPLALGSQTIGSIARPAAFCGIVGFKPGLRPHRYLRVHPLLPVGRHHRHLHPGRRHGRTGRFGALRRMAGRGFRPGPARSRGAGGPLSRPDRAGLPGRISRISWSSCGARGTRSSRRRRSQTSRRSTTATGR